MESSFINENSRERERLRTLVSHITDEELKLVIYKEGWTIAVALAHLAFWDQRRLVMVRKWQKKGVTPSPIDADEINDTLLPLFLLINPREAANMAVSSAETLDRQLENLSSDLISAIERLGDHNALNRAIHRKKHLDEIDLFLKHKGGVP